MQIRKNISGAVDVYVHTKDKTDMSFLMYFVRRYRHGKDSGHRHQDFGRLIENNLFYVDKTKFIKEWWENGDAVTLITRPRRFGKTLNMSMLEQFFSVKYADKGNLFEGLAIWQEEIYRQLHETYPVISLSFASVKESSFSGARKKICQIIKEIYNRNDFQLRDEFLNEDIFRGITESEPVISILQFQ